MATPRTPATVFPYGVDDYRSLCLVHNMSESKLASLVSVDSSSIEIIPDFDKKEIWSQWGGWLHIDDEDIYYERGYFVYDQPMSSQSIDEAILSSSALEIDLRSQMAVDSLNATTASTASTAAIPGSMYTFAGTAMIGDTLVDFSVKGNGQHGSGAVFAFHRPDLVEKSLCRIDADNGTIYIAAKSYLWTLVSGIWMQPPIGEDGSIGKRITKMTGLVRGCNSTIPAQHATGSLVRGYIRAEHYRLLADAIAQIEILVGTDMSEDRNSIDFRLRDMTDMCMEKDDVECVDVAITQEPSGDECDPNGWIFNVEIDGIASGRTLHFGDGTSTSEIDNVRHSYLPGTRIEPTIVAWNDECTTSTARFVTKVEQPEAVAPVTIIDCPPVSVPDIIISTDFLVPECPECAPSIPDIVFPGMSISIPSSISIPQVTFSQVTFPQITFPQVTFPQVTFPQVTFQTVTFPPVNVNLNAEFFYTVSVIGPEGTGPCFQLVPCGPGHCHGL